MTVEDLKKGVIYSCRDSDLPYKCIGVNVAHQYATFEVPAYFGSSIKKRIELTNRQIEANID